MPLWLTVKPKFTPTCVHPSGGHCENGLSRLPLTPWIMIFGSLLCARVASEHSTTSATRVEIRIVFINLGSSLCKVGQGVTLFPAGENARKGSASGNSGQAEPYSMSRLIRNVPILN